jgi:hypothetical protein
MTSAIPTRAFVLCAALTAAGLARPAVAAENVPPCPESIRVDQKIAEPVQGWDSPRESVSHRLIGVQFSSGHPSEQAEEQRGAERVAHWVFGAGGRGNWMACVYARTNVLLARRLAPDVKRCDVVTDPLVRVEGRQRVQSVTCR